MPAAHSIARNGPEDPARERSNPIKLAARVETLPAVGANERRAFRGEARHRRGGGDEVLHRPEAMRADFMGLIADPD
eukprot:1850857-Alexandrium_andersonii.AAC.1